MKKLCNRLIPAVFFTIGSIVGITYFVMQHYPVVTWIAPIMTGVSALFFWLLFIMEQIEKRNLRKKNNE